MALPSASRASTSDGSAETIAFTRSSSPALMASKNAAAGDPSRLRRFYPRLAEPAIVLSALTGAAAHAQTQAARPSPAATQNGATAMPLRERPALGSTITVTPLGELPANENALSLLDAAQADLIS